MPVRFGDLLLFLSSQLFVLGGAVAGFATFLYGVWPYFVGSLDEGPESVLMLIAFLVGMLFSGLLLAALGLLLWPIAVRPFVTTVRFNAFSRSHPQLPVPVLTPAFRRITAFFYPER